MRDRELETVDAPEAKRGAQKPAAVQVLIFVLVVSSALFWAFILWLRLPEVELVACVLLPEGSIKGELLSKVVFPALILGILFSVVTNSLWARRFRIRELWIGILSILLIPMYLLSAPSIIVDDPQCLQALQDPRPLPLQPF